MTAAIVVTTEAQLSQPTRCFAFQEKRDEHRNKDDTDNPAKDIQKDKHGAAGRPSGGSGGTYSKVVHEVANSDNSEVGETQHHKGAWDPLGHGVSPSKS